MPRNIPPNATAEEKALFDYIVAKVDPLMVPLMQQIVDKRPDDVAAFCMAHLSAASSFETERQLIVFVLGGPGSGKGTQCSLLVEKFGFFHVSAGDLLRAESSTGSETAKLINTCIKEGEIVPSEITVNLLKTAIKTTTAPVILIDGFPRALDQAAEFNRIVGVDCDFVLFFDCPEEKLTERLLERGKTSGRADDNLESIQKRFVTFHEQSMPVISRYEKVGKVRRVDSSLGSPIEVFRSVAKFFI